MARDPFEWYPTPASYTRALWQWSAVGPDDVIIEPCVGDGAILNVLRALGWRGRAVTNDLDARWPADEHRDATSAETWRVLLARAEALRAVAPAHARILVVTNPPFSAAARILACAMSPVVPPQPFVFSTTLLLRLTFLEPTEDRVELLNRLPDPSLYVMPRFSFQRAEIDGKWRHDSVTVAWMHWRRGDYESVVRVANVDVIQACQDERPAFRARVDAIMATRAPQQEDSV